MQKEECTCTISMMADHNAVCKACSTKQATVKEWVPSILPVKSTKIFIEQCTCDMRMMVDHNATCDACSKRA